MPSRFNFRADPDRKVLFLELEGSWDIAEAEAYRRALSQQLERFDGAGFDVVSDISRFAVQKPEVNAIIQDTMGIAKAAGMQRSARVVSSSMTKMQFERISEASGLPIANFFGSVNEALKWLGK